MADGVAQPRSAGATAGTRRSREGLFRYLVGAHEARVLRVQHLVHWGGGSHPIILRPAQGSRLFEPWPIGKHNCIMRFSMCAVIKPCSRNMVGQGSMVQVTSFVDRVLYYREGFRRGCLHGGGSFYVFIPYGITNLSVVSVFLKRVLLLLKNDEAMGDESTTKLLKVARMAFPIGIVATTVGCFHELWKQKIKLSDPSAAAVFSFEDPYVQAILISDEMVVVYPLSQATYGACLLFAYWFYFLSCHVSKLHCILPCSVQDWMDYDRKLWQTCVMFTGQSLKELLVQKGQELVPFSSSYLDEYGVVDRLGSLVVRLIFRPFEESNRLKFAEMASEGLFGSLKVVQSGRGCLEAGLYDLYNPFSYGLFWILTT
ncbi:hypothetical protein ACP70R_022428 [Stipagrostis hirtigluma subsp. patula]